MSATTIFTASSAVTGTCAEQNLQYHQSTIKPALEMITRLNQDIQDYGAEFCYLFRRVKSWVDDNCTRNEQGKLPVQVLQERGHYSWIQDTVILAAKEISVSVYNAEACIDSDDLVGALRHVQALANMDWTNKSNTAYYEKKMLLDGKKEMEKSIFRREAVMPSLLALCNFVERGSVVPAEYRESVRPLVTGFKNDTFRQFQGLTAVLVDTIEGTIKYTAEVALERAAYMDDESDLALEVDGPFHEMSEDSCDSSDDNASTGSSTPDLTFSPAPSKEKVGMEMIDELWLYQTAGTVALKQRTGLSSYAFDNAFLPRHRHVLGKIRNFEPPKEVVPCVQVEESTEEKPEEKCEENSEENLEEKSECMRTDYNLDDAFLPKHRYLLEKIQRLWTPWTAVPRVQVQELEAKQEKLVCFTQSYCLDAAFRPEHLRMLGKMERFWGRKSSKA
ncbi:hypothetical protein SAICODRAFT_24454 [Saitoella complicata NRRL Y-17804]|uniref:Uncharacterized protein n=1 Tax=Saitoella complicata (strain BCRC 22490 / CBS 7301 / JCM 7358 / NBRC 10748 / NRRL Y-17804) TaxID=698492 RepID=A0A0E9NHA2_SAICN|nr:uncharacterized protein SAICODRAFT_24454 [Saitoella complicata NRRL Y-17804]ODQ54140.1 hypothetical protein SAICODRAFT_24454 [Saitoella complicata NRRL Y-17804]GAO49214.1 hypothetical protein G7K_3372-t1 [Saitoella complicata NRRL Y-17804]